MFGNCTLFAVFLLAAALATGNAGAEAPPLTAQQKERLKEAEQLAKQVAELSQQGKVREAILLALKVKEIRGQLLKKHHPDYITSLNELAYLYSCVGDYARALPLCQEMADIRKKELGEKDPEYAVRLNEVALLKYRMGNYGEAEPLFLQALDILRQTRLEAHPNYGTILDNLALLYQEQGSYNRAERLHSQALEIHKRALGDKHPFYARSANNLALLYQLMGNYAKAEALYGRVLAIQKQVLGEKHPEYAVSLNNLAWLYVLMRKHEEQAELLLQQARDIYKNNQLEKHPHCAACLNNLAYLYRRKGREKEAEDLFRKVLAIYKQTGQEKHPRYAACLNNLALLCQEKGDVSEAASLYQQALAIHKQAVGEQHTEYARCLHNFALCQVAAGKPSSAVPFLFQAIAIVRRELSRTAAVQSQTQQLASVQEHRLWLDGLVSVTTDAEVPAGQVYDELLLWKGAVLARREEMQRFRTRLERDGKKAALADYDDLVATTRRLANLLGASAGRFDSYRKPVQELSERIEQLEQKLAGESANFRNQREQRRRTCADLVHALPANAAFIDLVEFHRYLPLARRKNKQQAWEPWLTAFIVRPNQPVVRVDLGSAEPVNEAVAKWREDFGSGETGAKMRQLVWEPLAPHLAGVTAVLISPDGGVLTRFPFAALPGKRPNTYLIEDVAVAVIAVPQQLPELLATEKKPADPSMLVVGAVNYGGNPGTAVAGLSRDAAQRLDGGRLSWNALPATGPEAHTIREQFQRLYPRGTVSELTGDAATEDAVRRLAGKRRYLHFATHGYYDPPGLRSMLADASRPEGLTGRQTITGWHPGLLCGLVLAGANRPAADGRDDGILTAMELGAFDLAGVDLAVLSACQTAQGEYVAGGEGLLGLQRAFQTAGARSVVASLWSVDDAATQKLMTRFYENLWQKKLPKLEALRQAQLSMLYSQADASARRDLATVPAEPADPRTARRSPRLWAAWVLSGDPGDLSQAAPVAERTSAYPPLAADSPAPRPPISPWLLAGLAAALAISWAAWRRFRRVRRAV